MIELDYRGGLADSRGLADCLTATGLSQAACRSKAELFAKAASVLPATERGDLRASFVPGRIEVLGTHNDYAGGRSMLVAVERGFCTVVAPRSDRRINVIDAVRGETAEFEFDPELVPRAGHWSNYPMTVARRIAKNFPDASRGANLAFASDLPPAAGMSSSSAMIVATFLALANMNDLARRDEYRQNIKQPTDLAGYLGTVENGQTFGSLVGDRGVGTFGGSEDHTTMLCAKANQLVQYTYCPVRFERAVPVPSDYTFAIAVSGVVAEKTGAAMQKYNSVSGRAFAVAELWRRRTGRDEPHLAAILASSPKAMGRLRVIVKSAEHEEFGTDALLSRLEHFIIEHQQIMPAAADALANGDIATFGRLSDDSQHATERYLWNQVPQTIFLASAARRHGAAAATAFGAGFGGSVWAMVEASRAGPFLTAWANSYRNEFPKHAEQSTFFTTGAGPAAFQLS